MTELVDQPALHHLRPTSRSGKHAVALPQLNEIALEPWRALAANAIEPNGYYLPAWATAVNGAVTRRANTTALAALAPDGSKLVGLMPVISAWRVYRLPLPVLVSADPFRSLDTPLIDAGAPEDAVSTLIERARETGARALIMRLLPLEGAVAQTITRVLSRDGLNARILNRHARAVLDATGNPNELLRASLGAKKWKELRRLRRRLAETGPVTFRVAKNPDNVSDAFDTFLRLEANGWKGQRGTALAQKPDEAARLKQAAIEMAAQGQCEIVTLSVGETPIASGIVTRHLDRAFFFKIGISEAHAAFSPGVQLTLDLTRHLCADPTIRSADSTAAPNHPMINHVWRGRMEIGDILIPLRRRDPMVPVIATALRAHGFARRTALRLLRR